MNDPVSPAVARCVPLGENASVLTDRWCLLRVAMCEMLVDDDDDAEDDDDDDDAPEADGVATSALDAERILGRLAAGSSSVSV